MGSTKVDLNQAESATAHTVLSRDLIRQQWKHLCGCNMETNGFKCGLLKDLHFSSDYFQYAGKILLFSSCSFSL